MGGTKHGQTALKSIEHETETANQVLYTPASACPSSSARIAAKRAASGSAGGGSRLPLPLLLPLLPRALLGSGGSAAMGALRLLDPAGGEGGGAAPGPEPGPEVEPEVEPEPELLELELWELVYMEL